MENKLNLALVIALSRVSQQINQSTRETITKEGITMGQFGVLEALYHKGDLTINEIINKVLSTSGNMTVVINNLEKSLLIEKTINVEDRRSAIIKITKEGKKLIEKIFPLHLKNIEKALRQYSKEEKKELLRLLKIPINKSKKEGKA